ncbi:YopN/LcrE/InvE/MxiC type III secretion system gatekeeper [Chromobacterium subtsugae]|uniref:YopN/LcrE/InvE/MxiC type III secretion system gatekeeper n=1 Tax=Chromobacterium subtsugae TaxID=251747 RepID=A0ABS7FEQ8_9NEIS|nr:MULTISPECIES: YopN/LcrE/InvE/MxiC type III secretion system gatekeeper [Chromobacterium]KUM02139.1 type III secretion system regulator InvE [Chromobacterium subtsugae]KZE88088.1 type III secretion system regulator InvE [Chromobacterium sp. F49]MBW7565743.1 YopN/LcrE/InvE/MxiC type III secretion system gatekeeper [Chromobacterium subtsugae]MBW8288552.1 YopN/LcrE/InvE/MxiC type III secretion system gatekeeper [Chromobacterium subtsugae]WSE89838.1 YopN/LcrE/InvE/MxiC type III secretion system 
MEINHRAVFSIGLRSPKQQARQEAQRDAVRQSEARQAEAQQAAEDASPAAELQRFAQSSDEMAAALTMFRNRRDYDKKQGGLADSFERVLDEEALPKSRQLLQVAKAHGLTAEELLRQARALFPDDSDLALVLRELLRRHQLDEVERKRLKALLKQVEEQAAPRPFKAGINCALKARLFGKALDLSPGLLRASYRQFLESDAPEAEIYQDWVASYGCQRRAAVLDFIEGALLADIDAQDPSCSGLEFGRLLGRLSQLKALRSADALFVGRMLANPLARRFNPAEADWLLLLLSLLQQPQDVDALLADTVGEAALLSRHADHSALLQTLYQACKALPPGLFADEAWQPALLEEFRRLAGVAYRRELAEKRRES